MVNGAEQGAKDLSNYATTGQAADILGVTRKHIALLLGQGKIKGIKLGHEWLVYIPSLDRYRETKSSKGRPPSREPKSLDRN